MRKPPVRVYSKVGFEQTRYNGEWDFDCAVWTLDPFQKGDTMPLQETAYRLEQQGYKATSQELYRLHGPRIYT